MADLPKNSLHQALSVCIVLLSKCSLLTWKMLGICLLDALGCLTSFCQANAKQAPSTCQLLAIYLAGCQMVVACHASQSIWQASTWEQAGSAWQKRWRIQRSAFNMAKTWPVRVNLPRYLSEMNTCLYGPILLLVLIHVDQVNTM